jgi:hypothetical protein
MKKKKEKKEKKEEKVTVENLVSLVVFCLCSTTGHFDVWTLRRLDASTSGHFNL